MTNLLSGRHKYLTNKNTKKGQKVRKISALSALKNGYCRVQILSEAVFLKWYLFFCTLYPQTSWLRKSEETREKSPKSWDFGGSKPWYLFWLHNMVAEVGLEPHDLRVMSPTSYQLLHSAILWCRWPGSNRYVAFATLDFKSKASACSATPARQAECTTLFHCSSIISLPACLVNPFLLFSSDFIDLLHDIFRLRIHFQKCNKTETAAFRGIPDFSPSGMV